jgi:hypothetical protein
MLSQSVNLAAIDETPKIVIRKAPKIKSLAMVREPIIEKPPKP